MQSRAPSREEAGIPPGTALARAASGTRNGEKLTTIKKEQDGGDGGGTVAGEASDRPHRWVSQRSA
eukprot:4469715-Pyramimonas_sp.AAC.1